MQRHSEEPTKTSSSPHLQSQVARKNDILHDILAHSKRMAERPSDKCSPCPDLESETDPKASQKNWTPPLNNFSGNLRPTAPQEQCLWLSIIQQANANNLSRECFAAIRSIHHTCQPECSLNYCHTGVGFQKVSAHVHTSTSS